MVTLMTYQREKSGSKHKKTFYFFLQLDLDATVADNGFAADIPALDENEPPAEIGDLSTIDTDTLDRLCEEVQPAQTSQLVQPTRVATSAQEVGEKLIGTCVTPTKVKAVQQTLGQERERHLCALKLLQSFFTSEELANSNTDGTYGKMCLDSAKLNSLKVLLFTKFPAGADEDKEKVWRYIKSKINSKCRAVRKFTPKDSADRLS